MSAITISREIGSMGDWIADEAAKRLGFRLINKQVLEHIFLQYGLVNFHEIYKPSDFWGRFDPHVSELVGMLDRLNQALAAHGEVVLVGRGGFAMLKTFADVLNVRIQAPLSLRIDHVFADQKFRSRSAAEEFVRQGDRDRQMFLDAAYGGKWHATSSFDLVIDTSKISTEIAVEMVVDSIIRVGHQDMKGKPTTKDLKIDPGMARVVTEALEDSSGLWS